MPVKDFVNQINKAHLLNISYGHQTINEAVPYKSGYVVEGATLEKAVDVHINSNEDGIASSIPVAYVDNGDQNKMGELRTEDADGYDAVTTAKEDIRGITLNIQLDQIRGHDGNMYWKVILANIGATPKSCRG